MTGETKVVEDGVPARRSATQPTPPWVWLAIGFAVGLGVGVVFFGPATGGGDDPFPETLPTIAAVEEAEGIAAVVPGFPDALLAVSSVEGQGLQYLIWPVGSAQQTHQLPGWEPAEVSFDVSGAWIATSTPVPDAVVGSVLSVGQRATLQPLASGVTSYAWHDSRAGFLSYVQPVAGMWALWVGVTRVPRLVTTELPVDGRVAAWGDWGWAIQDVRSGVIQLLNQEGELRDTQQGVAYDSHVSGWVVFGDDGLGLLSAGGGVRRLDLPLRSIGAVVEASLSPDRERVAVLGNRGLLIAAVDAPAEEPIVIEGNFGATQLAWTTDSGFVMTLLARGILVVDVEDGSATLLLDDRTFIAVGVIHLPVS